jgi:hydrogenase nickel incorporation protein HypA/HybF
MHELSIAMSVLDALDEESQSRGGAHITAVYLKIGPLSGVVPQALQGAFDLAREGTDFAECRLVIEETSVLVRCPNCGVEREVQSIQEMACAVCGTAASDVASGRELEVHAVEICE